MDYVGNDGHVHELRWDEDGWHHHDLTGASGTATAAPQSPAGYASFGGNTQHVNYLGTDGFIHELEWNGVLCAYPFPVTCTRQLACTNAEGRIHHLWWDEGVWHHEDLSNTGAPLSDFAPLSGYAFNSQRTQHVIYAEIEGLHVYELWWQARDVPTAEIP